MIDITGAEKYSIVECSDCETEYEYDIVIEDVGLQGTLIKLEN